MKKADLLAGVLFLAAGVLILEFWPFSGKSWPSMLTILGAGALFLAWDISGGAKERDGSEQDERTERINSPGFRYSWYCTFAGVLVLRVCRSLHTPGSPLKPVRRHTLDGGKRRRIPGILFPAGR